MLDSLLMRSHLGGVSGVSGRTQRAASWGASSGVSSHGRRTPGAGGTAASDLLGRETRELVAGGEELERREPRHHRLGEQEEHHEVDDGADAESEREALHDTDREDV